MVKIICAWCKKDLETKADDRPGSIISHGICRDCSESVLSKATNNIKDQKIRLQLEGVNILSWLETGATVWAQEFGFALPKPEISILSGFDSYDIDRL